MEKIEMKWENDGGSIRKWQISKNKEIVKGQALAACVINKKVQTLYSTTEGRVEKILVQDGQEFKPGQPLVSIIKCAHPCQVAGMCILCKLDVRDLNIASEVVVASNPHITLSRDTVSENEKALIATLHKERKLYLILDIDQTILHTTPENHFTQAQQEQLGIVPIEVEGQSHFVKFRPGLGPFLTEVFRFYKIHIYTNGSRTYAKSIVNAVHDTFGKYSLFGDEEQRILTRCDTFPERPTDKKKKNKPYLHKTLTSIYPHLDRFAVILDDREDIWSDSIENVVRIYPYNFDFFLAGDINDPALILEKTKKRQRDEPPSDPPIIKIQKTEEMNDIVGENVVSADAFASEQGIGIESSLFGETPWQSEFGEENMSSDADTFQQSELDFGALDSSSIPFDSPIMEPEEQTSPPNNTNDEAIAIEKEKAEEGTTEKGDVPQALKVQDNDDHLACILGVLKDIHYNYFKQYDKQAAESKQEVNVKSVIDARRKLTLFNCKLVMDGVSNKELSTASRFGATLYRELNPEVTHIVSRSPESKLVASRLTLFNCKLVMDGVSNKELSTASRFGATLYRELNPEVTHIVSRSPESKLVASRTEDDEVYVVGVPWLWESVFRWERQDETLFGLPGVEVVLGEAPVIHSELFDEDSDAREDRISSDSSSSLDDNIFGDVEKLFDSDSGSEENSEEK